jgi:hypothetical protein
MGRVFEMMFRLSKGRKFMKIQFLTIVLFLIVTNLLGDEMGDEKTHLSLNGTFSGSASDSSGPGQMTWKLTQEKATVRGTVTAKTQLGLVAFKGTLYGTISKNTLNFVITIPKGGISGLPTCTSNVLGSTTDVTDTTINGTYTGDCSCTGSFKDGKLTLTKQNTP